MCHELCRRSNKCQPPEGNAHNERQKAKWEEKRRVARQSAPGKAVPKHRAARKCSFCNFARHPRVHTGRRQSVRGRYRAGCSQATSEKVIYCKSCYLSLRCRPMWTDLQYVSSHMHWGYNTHQQYARRERHSRMVHARDECAVSAVEVRDSE